MMTGPPIKREREQLKILHACKEGLSLSMCWGMTDSMIITIMHLLESSVLKEDPKCS